MQKYTHSCIGPQRQSLRWVFPIINPQTSSISSATSSSSLLLISVRSNSLTTPCTIPSPPTKNFPCLQTQKRPKPVLKHTHNSLCEIHLHCNRMICSEVGGEYWISRGFWHNCIQNTKAMQPRQTRGLTQLGLQSLQRRNNVVSYKCGRVNMDVVGIAPKVRPPRTQWTPKCLSCPFSKSSAPAMALFPKKKLITMTRTSEAQEPILILIC